jgi:cellulose synthase/poly-beta-1,6-N-acetylglucosamine synthase-like glycosyltransferase
MWLLSLAFFWSWWLRSDHVVTLFGMVVNSMMFMWSLFLPGWFFVHLGRMARPDPELDTPRLRVAIIVTKAPAEPWAMVCRTLRAMLRQEMPYPYDVWLADEAPLPETLQWCDANGVRVSTRKERPDYHRASWPRRTKCKEGNLAFFYDTWGYRDYDVVAQLDADHRPTPGYLREMVRPFIDPDVGYVAAPSICDANAQACWAARGRLYKEAGLHGPQQAGCHHRIPPVCTGSHYAVRTAALQEIGGLGPELSEDFSTSLMMNAFGWRGVYALDAEAHGEGPETFADFVTQELQWARSMNDVTLQCNRIYWRGLDRSAKLKLGFGESWYPLHALYMLAASLFPVVALLTATPWANVRLVDFFAHVLVVSSVLFVVAAWVRANGWLRPADVPLFSWEVVLFLFTRWPWVLWGFVQSWAGWALGRRFGFKVTPKGIEDTPPLGLRAIIPYLLIASVSSLTALLQGRPGAAQGYYYFCLLNAVIYLAVAVAVIGLHLSESGALRWNGVLRLAIAPSVATTLTAGVVATAIVARGALAAQALLPARVWRLAGGAVHAVSVRLFPTGSVALATWLVLGVGVTLVIGSLWHASRPRAWSAWLRTAATRGSVNAALFAVAGCSGIAFVILAAIWHEGGGASWTGVAAPAVGTLALSASILARLRFGGTAERWPPIDDHRRPTADRRVAPEPESPGVKAALARAPADALPPTSMPAPLHRRARSARPSRAEAQKSPQNEPGKDRRGAVHDLLTVRELLTEWQDKDAQAVAVWLGVSVASVQRQRVMAGKDPAATASASAPAVALPQEVAIDWWSSDGAAGFRLRSMPGGFDGSLVESSPTLRWSEPHPPSRTAETSRAHAIFYDRLVRTGWEPCGRDEPWYAHRFRRAAGERPHGLLRRSPLPSSRADR